MEPGTVVKPCITEQLAIEIAHRLYGLQVIEIKKMNSFDDQNFHIKVSQQHVNPFISSISDNGYTLKVTNARRSSMPGHFDAMHTVMEHLKSKGLCVPTPVPTLEGKTWTLEKVPLLNEGEDTTEPKLCGIHLLNFISGVPVCTQPYTKDLLFQWGLLLAKCHNATEDFLLPSSFQEHIFWNLEHIPEIKRYMANLQGPRKTLVLKVIDKYPSEITKNFGKLRKGVIHGDFNENNILAQVITLESGEKSTVVNGILDLEDIHHGTYVWDLGVLMAYALLDCKAMDPLEGSGHALAGYLSLRQLSNIEMSVLKTCIESRLSQSLVLCAYEYQTDPSNTYILTSGVNGWTRLEQICNISNDDLLQKWKEIQDSYAIPHPQA